MPPPVFRAVFDATVESVTVAVPALKSPPPFVAAFALSAEPSSFSVLP
jgi:hypothetical protein